MATQVNWRFRQLCNAMFYDALHTEHALHIHAPVASDGVHRLD